MTESTSPKQKLVNLRRDIDGLLAASEAENYADIYKEDPETFDKLLKIESRAERKSKQFFKEVGKEMAESIDWNQYQRLAKADRRDEVERMISASLAVLEEKKKLLVNISFDMFREAELTGMQAASNIHKMPADFTSLENQVLKSARENSNRLVRRVSSTTRERLRQNLASSIQMGEELDDAMNRVQMTLRDDTGIRSRAIARTEPVNAYGEGVQRFGEETGARKKVLDVTFDGKTSQICKQLHSKYGYEDQAQSINRPFTWSVGGGGSQMRPGFHVNCRTGMYLLY